jgi:hypothetical protein
MQITIEHRTGRASAAARHTLPPWELYQAWRAAYDEADLALVDWRCAAMADRADAYAVYRAAADREDAAAEHWLMT